jgi:hypothetical protein
MIAMTTKTPPTAPPIMGPGVTGDDELKPGGIPVVAEKGTVAVAINTNFLHEFSQVIDT